jgi:alginate O-acetyltransferase complex protein AlgJ
MKNRVIIFICVALLTLTVVPAINLKFGNTQKQGGKKWWSRDVLYNIDFALPFMSRFFYPLGISIDPNQVIIGKNGWLYLGDKHQNAITVKRRGATAEDTEVAKRIGLATKSWAQWLKLNGVRQYQIMLAPNKDTIYPEFLPDWAQPATANSVINTLLANVSQEIYLDTGPALRAAKSHFSEPLYHKTDSHWNQLGSWVAFHALSMKVARTEAGLHWLSPQSIRQKVESIGGCDLGGILRIAETLQDSRVLLEIVSEYPIETELYDLETGRLIASGDTSNKISYPHRPVLVNSKHALNQKRVLWLLDSFGVSGMIPFMTATFTETLIFNYGTVDPDQFAQLVDKYKPDYVFMTVGERYALVNWFENPPPTKVSSGKMKNFISLSHGVQSGIHDMIKVERAEAYRITGADPYVTFVLPNPIRTQDASQLVFELTCGEKKEPVQVQLFWHTDGTVFSEANSVRFTTNPGITTLSLSPLLSWDQAEKVTDVRIDIDSHSACPVLTINSLEFGKLSAHPNTLEK